MSIYPPESHTRSFRCHQDISTLCRRKYMEDKYRENIQGKGELSAKVSTRDYGGNCRRKRSP